MLMPAARNAQTDGQHWRLGIIETLRHWLNDSMPLTYPHSQHNKDETLADFFPCRLECFKHFSNFLFETERAQNATRVHIQRRDRPDWNHRASAAMVGRTGHRGAWPPGAPPHL